MEQPRVQWDFKEHVKRLLLSESDRFHPHVCMLSMKRQSHQLVSLAWRLAKLTVTSIQTIIYLGDQHSTPHQCQSRDQTCHDSLLPPAGCHCTAFQHIHHHHLRFGMPEKALFPNIVVRCSTTKVPGCSTAACHFLQYVSQQTSRAHNPLHGRRLVTWSEPQKVEFIQNLRLTSKSHTLQLCWKPFPITEAADYSVL